MRTLTAARSCRPGNYRDSPAEGVYIESYSAEPLPGNGALLAEIVEQGKRLRQRRAVFLHRVLLRRFQSNLFHHRLHPARVLRIQVLRERVDRAEYSPAEHAGHPSRHLRLRHARLYPWSISP